MLDIFHINTIELSYSFYLLYSILSYTYTIVYVMISLRLLSCFSFFLVYEGCSESLGVRVPVFQYSSRLAGSKPCAFKLLVDT